MKPGILLVFIALLSAAAQEPTPAQRVIAISPDHQYEVVVLEDAWCVRDMHTQAVLTSPDFDSPYTPGSGGTALWSPDSRKVVFAYRVNNHGGDDYFVLAIDGAKLVLLRLPDDAIPIKWTADNTLLCSVRIDALLTFDPETKTFHRNSSTSPDK